MIEFVNLATSLSLNFGSGMIFRLGTSRRRGIFLPLRITLRACERGPQPRSGLGPLHTILGALAVAGRLVRGAGARRAGGVERAADNVIPNPREILHAAAADEHDRVLLKVVTLTRDVAR